MKKFSFLKKFLIGTAVLLGIIAGIVILFDPFYQYHKPLPGLKAVLTEREYQCIGSLRTFTYDSVILGSSVTENFHNKSFDEAYGVTSIKAVRASGSTADLMYLLDVAYEHQNIKKVFYSVDLAALSASTEPSFASSGCPMYLYNKNPLDDVVYLWNKDVLLEKIPYMLIQSLFGDYDEGESFQWGSWKTFGAEDTISRYQPLSQPEVMKPKEEVMEVFEENKKRMVEQIEKHPETNFQMFFPPYSLLWWDDAYRTGNRENYFYMLEALLEEVLAYPNVEVFYFQNERDIILNLNYYMDNIHFSPEINDYMVQQMKEGNYQVYVNSYREEIKEMKIIADEIQIELIPKLYPDL